MKSLVLAFTQGEKGAPGFLSRKGEDAAKNLAESVGAFLQDTLGLGWHEDFLLREERLQNDLRTKLLRSAQDFPAAVSLSLGLFSNALLLSGAQEASLNTAGWVGELLALPVCVLQELDSFVLPVSADLSQSEPDLPLFAKRCLAKGFSSQFEMGLERVFLDISRANQLCPQVLLISSNFESLCGWLRLRMPEQQWQTICAQLWDASHQGVSPVVFTFGCEYQPGHEEGAGFSFYFD